MTSSMNASLDSLRRMMASYHSYAFVANEEMGAKALFRGRWTWETVSKHLSASVTTVVISDERASGFVRYRLYGMLDGCPVCLAEIEVYLSRQMRTTFWCGVNEASGNLALAA